MVILSAEYFVVLSTYHQTKQKNLGQLDFGRDLILLINNIVNWKYICQRKQAQIEKYVIRKNFKRIDYDYNIGNEVMFKRNHAYKYETPLQCTYENIQTWMNGTINIKMGAVTARLNLSCLKP